MKLNVHQIEEVAKELVYKESTASLNALLLHGGVCDFEFPAAAEVRLDYYRAGQELLFQGHISGSVIGHCARCVEDFGFRLEKDFFVAMVPKQELPAEAELSGEDLDLSFYEGDEIDLSPLVREQIILGLPTRPLCREDCKGLCPHCGANQNTQPCGCTAAPGDARLAVLRNLKVRR
ncbi:MAG: DUF177 domain-containing protein [Candidatus Binatia bacterium]